MTNAYDRSLVFTALLEEREIASMESMRGMRVVSDAMEHVEADQRLNPTLTLWESVQTYVASIKASGKTWEQHVDALLAADAERAKDAGLRGLPEGMRLIGPLEGSSRNP